MKLAVFTDIHGNYEALNIIINHINKNNYDKVIFLGDAIGLGVDSDLCLKLIKKNNIKFIIGNHEYYFIKGIENIKSLDKNRLEHEIWTKNNIKTNINNLKDYKYELEINNIKFTFLHYFMNNDEDYPYEHLSILRNNEYKKVFDKIDSDYTFYGHLHDDRYDEINNKKYYGLNSSGCVKDDKTFYYEINISEYVKVKKIYLKFDRKELENKLLNTEFPDKKKILNECYGISIK